MRFDLELGTTVLSFTSLGTSGPLPLLVSVGNLHLSARAGFPSGFGVSESSSMEVMLDNSRREAATLIGLPFRERGYVYDDDDALIFAGIVASVAFGRLATIGMES